jgi:hypothetical protein
VEWEGEQPSLLQHIVFSHPSPADTLSYMYSLSCTYMANFRSPHKFVKSAINSYLTIT